MADAGEAAGDGVAVGVFDADRERAFLGNVWAGRGRQKANIKNAIGYDRCFIGDLVRLSDEIGHNVFDV